MKFQPTLLDSFLHWRFVNTSSRPRIPLLDREHEFQEAQAEKASLLTQKEASEKKKKTLQTAVAELEEQIAEVNGHIGEFQEKLEGLTVRITSLCILPVRVLIRSPAALDQAADRYYRAGSSSE